MTAEDAVPLRAMSLTAAFISELIWAANQAGHLTAFEKRRMLERAAPDIANYSGWEGIAFMADILEFPLTRDQRQAKERLHDAMWEFNAGVKFAVCRYRGEKLSSIFQDIEKRFSRKLPLNFEALYRVTLSRRFAQDLEPIPGVLPMLGQLKHPRCIASGGPPDKVVQTLDLSGLAPYFGTDFYSSYDIGSFKPDPGLFLHAAQKMGFEPRRCVVVEDSLVDIQAAKAAGMVALLYSPSPPDDSYGADVTFANTDELTTIISSFED
jgi:HAD superfamily hydrolase (TIGR01509 family)